MEKYRINEMVKGWFVGDFAPAAFLTSAAEVGVKVYSAGTAEARHHHKIATEITLIQDGEVEMNGVRYAKGEIIVVSPGESMDFLAVTDAVTVVVKVPAVQGDKYLG